MYLWRYRCTRSRSLFFSFFFFNDPATTEIYTLSLHDALPISTCPPSSRRKSRERSAISLPVTPWLRPRAGALHRSALDAAFVRGQLRLHPFRPTDVQLLAEQPELCQLQSGFRPDVSELVPAIHDERLVPRELARHLLQLVERDAERALDVRLGERVAAAGVDQHDLLCSRFLLDPVDHGLLLGFRAQL